MLKQLLFSSLSHLSYIIYKRKYSIFRTKNEALVLIKTIFVFFVVGLFIMTLVYSFESKWPNRLKINNQNFM